MVTIGGSKEGGGGPNSFIFKQFSAKSLKNNPILGVGAPLRKILDPHWFQMNKCPVNFLNLKN